MKAVLLFFALLLLVPSTVAQYGALEVVYRGTRQEGGFAENGRLTPNEPAAVVFDFAIKVPAGTACTSDLLLDLESHDPVVGESGHIVATAQQRNRTRPWDGVATTAETVEGFDVRVQMVASMEAPAFGDQPLRMNMSARFVNGNACNAAPSDVFTFPWSVKVDYAPAFDAQASPDLRTSGNRAAAWLAITNHGNGATDFGFRVTNRTGQCGSIIPPAPVLILSQAQNKQNDNQAEAEVLVYRGGSPGICQFELEVQGRSDNNVAKNQTPLTRVVPLSIEFTEPQLGEELPGFDAGLAALASVSLVALRRRR